MHKIEIKDKYTLDDLFDILSALRGENGCPWDKVQTHETLKKCLIEEAYETVDAIESGNDALFANELGDVLMQVAFHSQIAKERNAFDFDDVLYELCTKLITRHTHVFGDDKAKDPEAALANWEKNKSKELSDKSCYQIINEIPHHLPALMRAEKVQKKAELFGAESPDIHEVSEKIEKLLKIVNNSSQSDDNKIKAYRQILFSVVALGRGLKLSPETEITAAIDEFIKNCKENETKKNTKRH